MTEDVPAQSAGDESATPRPRTRRRRRGGRGRGRSQSQSGSQEQSQTSAEAEAGPSGEEPSEKSGEPKAPQQRRSRTRSRPSRGKAETKAADDTSTEASSTAGTAEAESQGAERASGSTSSRSRSRRRRRGGSRSGDTGVAAAKEAAAGTDGDAKEAGREEPAAEGDGGGAGAATTSAARRRRRRRRRKPSGEGDGKAKAAEAAGTPAAAAVAGVPAPAEKAEDGGAARAAPTRTSRAGRRGGPLRRRRRPDVQVERRTEKTMLMAERDGRVEIVVLEARDLVEHFVARSGAQSMVGNVYLGKVQSVLPGMEAAFVDVGRGRNAVLYAGEVSYDEDVEEGQRRIERVLKPGQSLVVQVTKDPMKGKGARLTAQISLPGRYLVYVPDGGASGISKRLPDGERERLRKIMKRIRPSEAGVIVRTAAEAATEEELAADLDRLKKAWESIRRKSRRGRAPRALYEEPDLLQRVVRDVFSPVEFQEIVTDTPELHERVTSYLREMAPDLLDRVRLHQGSLPLFEAFHVAEQIHKALERKVWLGSGGYLVIDRTEAMTVIDVNTGKHVGKTNLEATVVQTNLEAAKEIPRQLRLRDIGGIIIIDFIDMTLQSNRDQVVQALREELAHDKTRSQVFDITHLGLLEVTRKKVSEGLLEAYSETCPTCEGRGILLTHDV
jgi:ribonuclease E